MHVKTLYKQMFIASYSFFCSSVFNIAAFREKNHLRLMWEYKVIPENSETHRPELTLATTPKRLKPLSTIVIENKSVSLKYHKASRSLGLCMGA